MVVAEVLTGIALVQKSVEFIKSNIQTANDIREIAGSIDDLFAGEKQVQQARNKKAGGGGLGDQFGVDTVAKEMIDAKIAAEHLQEVATMVDMRFGHGTWEYILEERKKRIDKRKKAIKEARAKALKKQQEIIEYVKWGFIAIATIAFISVSLLVTFKFFVTLTPPLYAHDVEHDDGSCLIYLPKYYLMCINESRELADTQVYLDYLKNRSEWLEVEE